MNIYNNGIKAIYCNQLFHSKVPFYWKYLHYCPFLGLIPRCSNKVLIHLYMESKVTILNWEVWGSCQFGCGILKMVAPKMQDFCQRINMLRGNFFKQSYDELWFVKKVSKLYFQSQFSMSKINQIFSKKKFHLKISI